MAHTLIFTTVGPLPSLSELEAWMTEQGEPFVHEDRHTLCLRALPLRLVLGTEGLRGEVELGEDVPLSRLVRVIFDLALRVGSEVRLAGTGPVGRPDLWVRFADEQDRRRIARALERADQRGHKEEVLTSLWALLCTLGHGQDLRWDPNTSSIVEVRDVRHTRDLDAVSISEEEPTPIGTVSVPVHGELHVLVWRWLSEAFPSLHAR